MKSHLEQIDEKIAEHRAEIEKLETARAVIANLDSPGGKPKAKAKAESGGMEFVIRKKGNGKQNPGRSKGRIKDADIRAAMAEIGRPAKVAEIAETVGHTDKRAKDIIRAAMNRFREKGVTNHDGDHRHYLVQPQGDIDASHPD